MSFALSSGVTGLEAQQKALEAAGNNLVDINPSSVKSGRVTFSELLKQASQSSNAAGGSNVSSVGIAGISDNMAQGNIVNTGNPLDMAIEGEGYFVLSDGSRNIYTRGGSFAVDFNSNLVDPSSGYFVQRIGSVGESDGFQTAGNSNIHVPFNIAMAAHASSEITVTGNLSADNSLSTAQTNVITSDLTFTADGGTIATGNVNISELDQFSGTATAGTITLSGTNHDGSALSVGSGFTVSDRANLDGLLGYINTILAANANSDSSVEVSSLVDGQIVITDGNGGYSNTDVNLTYKPAGAETLTMPGYFEVSTVGGEQVKNVDITVCDSRGDSHVLSAAFVRSDTGNSWDMILTSITGDVDAIDISGNSNRRIKGIEFDSSDGSYSGLNPAAADKAQFVVTFAHDRSNPQTIAIDMGMPGKFNGLTQFAGNSTAVAREQNGYPSGRLSSVSVNNEGALVGTFSNGIKKDIATVQIALFQNASGLENIGNCYLMPCANSGAAVATEAMTGGAGSIHGGALEKSNADVANEFVDMIQAQNSFQANAKTIKIANDILRELTGLIT